MRAFTPLPLARHVERRKCLTAAICRMLRPLPPTLFAILVRGMPRAIIACYSRAARHARARRTCDGVGGGEVVLLVVVVAGATPTVAVMAAAMHVPRAAAAAAAAAMAAALDAAMVVAVMVAMVEPMRRPQTSR